MNVYYSPRTNPFASDLRRIWISIFIEQLKYAILFFVLNLMCGCIYVSFNFIHSFSVFFSFLFNLNIHFHFHLVSCLWNMNEKKTVPLQVLSSSRGAWYSADLSIVRYFQCFATYKFRFYLISNIVNHFFGSKIRWFSFNI